MIKFRRIKESDTKIYREIRLKSLSENPDYFGSTYIQALERDEKSWKNQVSHSSHGDNSYTLLAFNNCTCIGLATLFRNNNPNEGELIQMWVASNFRRKGIATNILEKLESWAQTVEINSISLSVTKQNNIALRFYEKYGFIREEMEIEIDLKRCLYGYRMTKELNLNKN